ncbi:hypothetical protein Hdeb2414_s0008g00290191 [Helianthus debilis subsp. tardiflorus]
MVWSCCYRASYYQAPSPSLIHTVWCRVYYFGVSEFGCSCWLPKSVCRCWCVRNWSPRLPLDVWFRVYRIGRRCLGITVNVHFNEGPDQLGLYLCKVYSLQRAQIWLQFCLMKRLIYNERLPLRFILQVLFFEQLRLRTSVAGCLYVSDSYNSQLQLRTSVVGLSSNDRDHKKAPPPSRIRDVPNGKNQDQENGELVDCGSNKFKVNFF